MINRSRTLSVKNYAKESMMSQAGCHHAVYGYCYATSLGQIVERLADKPEKIRYFYNDLTYGKYVDFLERRYDSCDSLNIYAVHRRDYETKLS